MSNTAGLIHTEFTCDKCKQDKTFDSTFTTGYGKDKEGHKICYECCALQDEKDMNETGKATLYLSQKFFNCENHYVVSNWPSSLEFKVNHMRIGKHNIARKVYVVYFNDKQGNTWIGKTYGDNTQICHCKRLKKQ